jgi:DNA-binding transcriptional LysR family regulator
MARNLDPTLLRAFIAVAETGGMTKAGRLLNLTQAAVSQQIKRLEELLGQRLFERDRREAVLTDGGDRLFPYARRVLELNDEVWGLMTSPDFQGEVKLGVPHDIVRPFTPPILRSFRQSWPKVRVLLICQTSRLLLTMLERGEIDMTLTTERHPGPHGEVLQSERLVWAGARGGCAHRRRPLPVSLGAPDCAFRRAAMDALAKAKIDWTVVCEDGNMVALYATLEADLSVSPILLSTLPEGLEPVPKEAALPELPNFAVNLYLPPAGANEVALELARHIRRQFATRFERVA